MNSPPILEPNYFSEEREVHWGYGWEQGGGITRGFLQPLCDTFGNLPLYEENSLWEALSVVSQKWIPFPTALECMSDRLYLAVVVVRAFDPWPFEDYSRGRVENWVTCRVRCHARWETPQNQVGPGNIGG